MVKPYDGIDGLTRLDEFVTYKDYVSSEAYKQYVADRSPTPKEGEPEEKKADGKGASRRSNKWMRKK